MRNSEAPQEETDRASVTSLDAARDRRRLEELARAHRAFLTGLARKLCRSGFDADDLVQDVLLKAVAHHDRLPPDVNHAAWMARVMHNLFIDRVRKREVPTTELDDRMPVTAPPDDRAWWESLSTEDVRAALPGLPAELRLAFERFAFDGRSYQEIADELGVPIATVGTRVLRARRRLRATLGGGQGDE